jgi:predicted transcriptional regulator
MTTLKVGIASYEDMKARTLAVARGEQRVAPDEPKVWFTSTESFAKVLSAGNRDLLRVIVKRRPARSTTWRGSPARRSRTCPDP